MPVHTQAARKKMFEARTAHRELDVGGDVFCSGGWCSCTRRPRACWYIFDMIVVASTFFCASALCLCIYKPSAGKDDMHGS